MSRPRTSRARAKTKKKTPRRTSRPRPLAGRRALFAQAYARNPNATRAAIAAGYSPKSAKQQGARLLTTAYVAARVHALQDACSARLQVDQDQVVSWMIDLALRARAAGVIKAGMIEKLALELVGRHVGCRFGTSLKVQGSFRQKITIEDLRRLTGFCPPGGPPCEVEPPALPAPTVRGFQDRT